MTAIRLTLLIIAALFFGGAAQAQDYPRPTGYVVDAANVLPPADEAALSQRLEALDQATGTQLAVVTVPSLGERTIEEYGIGLLRAWGVGQAETDRGAILLVAPGERRVRIEVGYGLEPVITDALSATIIRREIIPRFRDGDLPGGIVAGADALIGHLQLPADEQRARADQAQQQQAQTRTRGGGFNWIGIVFWLVVLGFVLLPAMFGRGSGRRRKGPWGVRGQRRRGGDVDWGIALWTIANIASAASRSGNSSGWSGGGGFGGGGGGFGGFGGGSGGGGGASGSW